MIPRFSSAVSARELITASSSLLQPLQSNKVHFDTLFPHASVHEISSARVGIKIALQALQLKPDAQIGVQPYTCSSVLSAIVQAGCKPVFIDINDNLTIDCHDLGRKVSCLDALIVTHTFGVPAHIKQIQQLVGGLPVLEDCAHAFLCQYNQQPVGTFFNMAVFSFGNGKFPAFGSGGLLVINDKRYTPFVRKTLSSLKKTGTFHELAFMVRQLVRVGLYSKFGYWVLYSFLNREQSSRHKQTVAYPSIELAPYRLVNWLINRQFNSLFSSAKKQQSNGWSIISKNKDRYTFSGSTDSNTNSFCVTILHKDRDKLYTHLVANGIAAGKHFQFARTWVLSVGYKPGDCPNFERLVDEIVTVPCSSSLSLNDCQKINHALSTFK